MDAISKVAQQVIDAVQSKNWMAVAILGIIVAVSVVRKYASKIHGPVGAWLNTDRGGSVLVLALTTFGGMATAAIAHQLTLNTVIGSVAAALLASGTRNVAYDLAKPADQQPPAGIVPLTPPKEPPKAA